MDALMLVSSVLALVILEVILGIDNLVFLSILTEKLPKKEKIRARKWGLLFAWMTRLGLLASAVYLTHLTEPLWTVLGYALSLRDLFLIIGGGFLILKATQEIHEEMIPEDRGLEALSNVQMIHVPSFLFWKIVVQIGVMDIIFSLDSVLTAVGLTNQYAVMTLAISIAIMVMIWASEPVAQFIEKYPTLKMLALSFLILIGTVLIADGLGLHVPRGYIYFSMGFSLTVESLNLIKRNRRKGR